MLEVNLLNLVLVMLFICIERKGEEDGIEKGSGNEKISIAKILRKIYMEQKRCTLCTS